MHYLIVPAKLESGFVFDFPVYSIPNLFRIWD
jgi:hypothetical protein